MASMLPQVVGSKLFPLSGTPGILLALRGLHTTPCAFKNIRAGIPKATIHRDKPLTYEQAQPPYQIGVRKGWNSWHTANLKGEGFDARAAERTFDDILIRRFIKGTWPGLFASEVIIKRRHNMISVAGLVFQQLTARKQYFLIGYSEEMLSYLMKCPVKLELQTVKEKRDVIFKKI